MSNENLAGELPIGVTGASATSFPTAIQVGAVSRVLDTPLQNFNPSSNFGQKAEDEVLDSSDDHNPEDSEDNQRDSLPADDSSAVQDGERTEGEEDVRQDSSDSQEESESAQSESDVDDSTQSEEVEGQPADSQEDSTDSEATTLKTFTSQQNLVHVLKGKGMSADYDPTFESGPVLLMGNGLFIRHGYDGYPKPNWRETTTGRGLVGTATSYKVALELGYKPNHSGHGKKLSTYSEQKGFEAQGLAAPQVDDSLTDEPAQVDSEVTDSATKAPEQSESQQEEVTLAEGFGDSSTDQAQEYQEEDEQSAPESVAETQEEEELLSRAYSAEAQAIIPSASDLNDMLDTSIDIAEAKGVFSLAAKNSAQTSLMMLKATLRSGIEKLLTFAFPVSMAKAAIAAGQVPALGLMQAERKRGEQWLADTQESLAQWERQWQEGKEAYVQTAIEKAIAEYEAQFPPLSDEARAQFQRTIDEQMALIDANEEIYLRQAKLEFMDYMARNMPHDPALSAFAEYRRFKDLNFSNVVAQVEAEKQLFSGGFVSPMADGQSLPQVTSAVVTNSDGQQILVTSDDAGVSMSPARPVGESEVDLTGDLPVVGGSADDQPVSEQSTSEDSTPEESEGLVGDSEQASDSDLPESDDSQIQGESSSVSVDMTSGEVAEGEQSEVDTVSSVSVDTSDLAMLAAAQSAVAVGSDPELANGVMEDSGPDGADLVSEMGLDDQDFFDDELESEDKASTGPKDSGIASKKSVFTRLPFLAKALEEGRAEKEEVGESSDSEVKKGRLSSLSTKQVALVGGGAVAATGLLILGALGLSGGLSSSDDSASAETSSSASAAGVSKEEVMSWYHAGDRLTIQNAEGASVAVTLTGQFTEEGALAKSSSGDSYTIGYQQLKEHHDSNPEKFESPSPSATS